MCAALHRDNGVDVRCGVGVRKIEGASRVERVVLSDGSEIAADVVVVGIGVVPNTTWLDDSGLDLNNGVDCDATLSTNVEGIVAAGDVARWPNPVFGESMRVEHWTNAVEQAEAATKRLLHGPDGAAPFASIPFVWSDQYDRKFQIAGSIGPKDEMRVCHGSLASRQFVALFGRGEHLVGALAVNRARLLMGYRRMIGKRVSFQDALAQASDD
jgi:NADPH-dependent 2,4-dienoyl-CoA reductase/sulfur reductase-like enzyme